MTNRIRKAGPDRDVIIAKTHLIIYAHIYSRSLTFPLRRTRDHRKKDSLSPSMACGADGPWPTSVTQKIKSRYIEKVNEDDDRV